MDYPALGLVKLFFRTPEIQPIYSVIIINAILYVNGIQGKPAVENWFFLR